MRTDGPWVTCDHMLWGDDFHLNYNFQAAFYVSRHDIAAVWVACSQDDSDITVGRELSARTVRSWRIRTSLRC